MFDWLFTLSSLFANQAVLTNSQFSSAVNNGLIKNVSVMKFIFKKKKIKIN